MNLFDAVPTVVKNNFWGYDVDDSISTKEVSNAVYEVSIYAITLIRIQFN